MIMPVALPSTHRGLECHIVDLPSGLCPVSKNPQPGSTITIMYCPRGTVLEVAHLYAYLHQYRGGLRDEQGTIIVRNMEEMIDRVARDCAEVLGVPVRVYANLVIAPKQHMLLRSRGYPQLVKHCSIWYDFSTTNGEKPMNEREHDARGM
jgi:hypothetical protein